MPRPVVAAAIVDSLSEPTMLLACSRAYPQELRGQFELPGGKVEEGEDPTAALTREIAEELGAHLTIGERVCPEDGQWWPILGGRVMGVWLAEVAAGSPAPRVGASHTLRPGGCPSRTSPCCRGSSLTCRLSRPWSPAALADSPAVRSGAQETGVRESSDRCCCVNIRFVPHALPFDDT